MKIRNKVMAGAGVAATLSGLGVLFSSGTSSAAVIIVDPILQPLLHLLVVLGL